MKPVWMRSSLIYIIILIVGVALFSRFFLFTPQGPVEIGLSEAITMSQNGEITKIVVDGETLHLTTVDGTELTTTKESNASLYDIPALYPPESL